MSESGKLEVLLIRGGEAYRSVLSTRKPTRCEYRLVDSCARLDTAFLSSLMSILLDTRRKLFKPNIDERWRVDDELGPS